MAQSAYPELVKTEIKLTQGDNGVMWNSKLIILSSGGNEATQLVKKLER